MKRFLVLPVVFILFFSTQSAAQFEIGASYEIRDEAPENGFGLRVEKGILESIPLIKLGLRAHFSSFNEENEVRPDGGFSYSRDISVYDFGLAATGGISLGLMQPFVSLGLGSETVDLSIEDFQGPGGGPEERDESNIYWNTSIGAKVTLLPILKPFIEYRYSNKELSKPSLADAHNGRVIFGVSLSF